MKKLYNKTPWVNGKTLVDEKKLGKIEDALEYLHVNAADREETVGSKSITGIEVVEDPELATEPKTLYLIVNPDTKALIKINLGSITIFQNP